MRPIPYIPQYTLKIHHIKVNSQQNTWTRCLFINSLRCRRSELTMGRPVCKMILFRFLAKKKIGSNFISIYHKQKKTSSKKFRLVIQLCLVKQFFIHMYNYRMYEFRTAVTLKLDIKPVSNILVIFRAGIRQRCWNLQHSDTVGTCFWYRSRLSEVRGQECRKLRCRKSNIWVPTLDSVWKSRKKFWIRDTVVFTAKHFFSVKMTFHSLYI